MGDPLNNSDGSVRGDGAQLGMSSCCREEEAPSQAIVSQWLNLASLSCTFSSYVTASTPILVCPNWLKTRFVSDSISCNGNSFFLFLYVYVYVWTKSYSPDLRYHCKHTIASAQTQLLYSLCSAFERQARPPNTGYTPFFPVLFPKLCLFMRRKNGNFFF